MTEDEVRALKEALRVSLRDEAAMRETLFAAQVRNTELLERCRAAEAASPPDGGENREIPDELLNELTRRWDVPMPFADAREALRESYRQGFDAGKRLAKAKGMP